MNLNHIARSVFDRPFSEQMHALLACLELIREELPAIGRSGLVVAQEYWTGNGRATSDLDDARVGCWQYLDAKNGDSTTIRDREDHAVRALICVLGNKPEQASDHFDTLVFFFEMLDALDECGSQVDQILS